MSNTVHFFNLTNGISCPHLARMSDIGAMHFTRVQSTQCEQKRWDHILDQAGADLLFHLAIGNVVAFHDVSEKPRFTRAVWQGMPWICFATRYIWDGEIQETKLTRRNNMNVTQYFTECVKALPKDVVKRVRYFEKFRTRRGEEVRFESMWCR